MRDYGFGNRLRHLREMKHLSQKALGQRLGVTDKAVSRWENGSSKPRGNLLRLLAACLETSIDLLLGGPQTPFSNAAPGSGNMPHPPPQRKGEYHMRINLIPKNVQENGNYLCTWGLQQNASNHLGISGRNIPEKQRNALTAELLFHHEDLYHPFPREERAGFYLLLDDGWDVPFDTDATQGIAPFGSVIPDEEKFPNMGDTPAQRLRAIAKEVEKLGYAGLGLWISPQETYEPDEFDWQRARAYWEERARWCHEAGIKYWKVDWGRHDNAEYREMMTSCVRKYAPGLLIEHAVIISPFSTFSPDGETAKRMQECLAYSDFLRTYDVSQPFADIETFFRVNALLSGVNKKNARYGTRGCINVESQPLVAAGLGLHLGCMFFHPDILACLRWQRLAPPFSAYAGHYVCSNQQVTDELIFDNDPDWWLRDKIGDTYSLTVPAVAARGTALPLVHATGNAPIVLASQHPETGAYAVSTLRRNLDPNIALALLADITIMPSDVHAPIGFFGRCRTLTIHLGKPIPQGSTVWAQCLLNDTATDVTDRIKWLEDGMEIDGRLLRKWGHDMKYPCAVHEPAVLLQIR